MAVEDFNIEVEPIRRQQCAEFSKAEIGRDFGGMKTLSAEVVHYKMAITDSLPTSILGIKRFFLIDFCIKKLYSI